MTFEIIMTFAVLIAGVGVFVREWLPVEMAALGGMCVLLAAGVLDEKDLSKVFRNPAPASGSSPPKGRRSPLGWFLDPENPE